MKTLFKLIIGLVVLVIIAALAAPYFISADSFKGQIVQQVQNATGRTLTIGGKLQMKFFPTVGITAENVSLSNPKDFGDKSEFVSLKSLTVSVATLPLLSKRIEIKDFILDEPNINLHVNKSGVKNWEFASAAPAPKTEEKPSETKAAPSASLPGGLILGGAEIKNGTIHYIDDTAKSTLALTKLNTTVDMKSMSAPFKLAGSGEWNGKVVKVSLDASSLEAITNHGHSDLALSAKGDLFSVEAKGAVEKDVFTGKASLTSPSLKDLALWANPGGKPLPTPAKLAFDFGGDVACNAGGCSVSNATISLDGLKAQGGAKVAIGGAKPSIDLDITTGVLDINPFLAPEKHAANDNFLINDAQADSGHWSDATIDLSALAGMNINANIKSDGLVYRKITIGKTPVAVKLQSGKLSIAIANAQLYKGTGSITIVADANASTYEMNATLKDVQTEPLLSDAEITDKFSGAADIQMNLTSRGRSQKEIISALGGNSSVKISNGVLKGVDLGNLMSNVTRALKVSNDSSQKTTFSDMSGTFAIANGVATNKDLSVVANGARITGQGTINLPAYTISYRLTPQLTSTAKNADGTTTQKQGISVPVVISGSLDNPSYQPDIGSVVQNALQNPGQLKQQLKNSGLSKKDLKGMLNGLR